MPLWHANASKPKLPFKKKEKKNKNCYHSVNALYSFAEIFTNSGKQSQQGLFNAKAELPTEVTILCMSSSCCIGNILNIKKSKTKLKKWKLRVLNVHQFLPYPPFLLHHCPTIRCFLAASGLQSAMNSLRNSSKVSRNQDFGVMGGVERVIVKGMFRDCHPNIETFLNWVCNISVSISCFSDWAPANVFARGANTCCYNKV